MAKPDQRSAAAQVYRAWYRTAEWRALRKAQLQRQPLCATCLRLGRQTPATIVDHRHPHRGNAGLFFDPANLASSCQPHHDSNKQSAERGGAPRQAVGADGWPI